MVIPSFLLEQYFGNLLIAYIHAFVAIALSIVVGKIVYWTCKGVLRRLSKKTKTQFDDILIDVLEEPLVILIVLVGIWYAASLLTLSEGLTLFVHNTLTILLILDIAYFVVKFIDSMIVNYLIPATAKTDTDLDDNLIPVIRKLIKFIIFGVTIIMIIANFGYDVTSIIAGFGIGGLAFAMAAKDVLGNFFGGVSIFSDRPFKIGDRVRVGGEDGHVEEIGMRSTRIRTLDGTKVTIPNSIVANTNVENVSDEDARKIKMAIGVTYDTSDKKMQQAMDIIREIVKENKDTDDNAKVWFDEFGDFALHIKIFYWIKNLDNIIPVKNDINMEIKKRFAKTRIEMTFPTQTLEIVKK
jgi:MscS family membrane protein